MVYDVTPPSPEKKTIDFFDFDNINFTNLDSYLTSFNWSDLYTCTDCNMEVGQLNDILNDSLNKFVPKRKISISPTKPWLNREIKEAINFRNQSYNTWRRNRRAFHDRSLDHNWKAYTPLRNRVISLIKNAKIESAHAKLNLNLPPKILWNNIK